MHCDKRAFATIGEADKELDRIRAVNEKRKKKNKIPIRSYRCEFCRLYHHTKKPDGKPDYIDAELTMKEQWAELLKKQEEKEKQNENINFR